MDTEETQVTEEIVETPVEGAETPAAEGAEGEETPAKEAAAAEGSAEDDKGSEAEGEEGEEGEEAEPEFKPNMKVKVGFYNKETNDYQQREFEIDKRFAPLMKDPESEKLVRELHERSHGLDSVKERFAETRQNLQAVSHENTEIKRGIDGLRGIVQTAIKTGNLLKLDDFFSRLNIPEQVVMKYALAKVQFKELPPEQQQMLQSNMEAERRQAEMEEQLRNGETETATLAQKLRAQELDYTLQRPEYKPIADAWDAKAGTPGAFYNLVAQVGELAWMKSKGKVDLTPEQAVKQVISGYGLKPPEAPNGGVGTPPPAQGGPAGKRVIQRPTNTIPNLQGRSGSPLKGKPKSMEDLLKLRDNAIAADAGG